MPRFDTASPRYTRLLLAAKQGMSAMYRSLYAARRAVRAVHQERRLRSCAGPATFAQP